MLRKPLPRSALGSSSCYSAYQLRSAGFLSMLRADNNADDDKKNTTNSHINMIDSTSSGSSSSSAASSLTVSPSTTHVPRFGRTHDNDDDDDTVSLGCATVTATVAAVTSGVAPSSVTTIGDNFKKHNNATVIREIPLSGECRVVLIEDQHSKQRCGLKHVLCGPSEFVSIRVTLNEDNSNNGAARLRNTLPAGVFAIPRVTITDNSNSSNNTRDFVVHCPTPQVAEQVLQQLKNIDTAQHEDGLFKSVEPSIKRGLVPPPMLLLNDDHDDAVEIERAIALSARLCQPGDATSFAAAVEKGNHQPAIDAVADVLKCALDASNNCASNVVNDDQHDQLSSCRYNPETATLRVMRKMTTAVNADSIAHTLREQFDCGVSFDGVNSGSDRLFGQTALACEAVFTATTTVHLPRRQDDNSKMLPKLRRAVRDNMAFAQDAAALRGLDFKHNKDSSNNSNGSSSTHDTFIVLVTATTEAAVKAAIVALKKVVDEEVVAAAFNSSRHAETRELRDWALAQLQEEESLRYIPCRNSLWCSGMVRQQQGCDDRCTGCGTLHVAASAATPTVTIDEVPAQKPQEEQQQQPHVHREFILVVDPALEQQWQRQVELDKQQLNQQQEQRKTQQQQQPSAATLIAHMRMNLGATRRKNEAAIAAEDAEYETNKTKQFSNSSGVRPEFKIATSTYRSYMQDMLKKRHGAGQPTRALDRITETAAAKASPPLLGELRRCLARLPSCRSSVFSDCGNSNNNSETSAANSFLHDAEMDHLVRLQQELGPVSLRGLTQPLTQLLPPNPHASKCFMQMLDNERANPGFVPFYHSYSYAAPLYEVQSAIAALLYGFDASKAALPRLLRGDFNGTFKDANAVREAVASGKLSAIHDHSAEFRAVALSCVTSLLASHPEMTPRTSFMDGYSCQDLKFEELLSRVLRAIGASSSASFSSSSAAAASSSTSSNPAAAAAELRPLVEKIQRLCERYGLRSGHMLQMLIHLSVVDKLAYASLPYGKVDTHRPMRYSDLFRHRPADGNNCSNRSSNDDHDKTNAADDDDHSDSANPLSLRSIVGQARVFCHPEAFVNSDLVRLAVFSSNEQFHLKRAEFQLNLQKLLAPVIFGEGATVGDDLAREVAARCVKVSRSIGTNSSGKNSNSNSEFAAQLADENAGLFSKNLIKK